MSIRPNAKYTLKPKARVCLQPAPGQGNYDQSSKVFQKTTGPRKQFTVGMMMHYRNMYRKMPPGVKPVENLIGPGLGYLMGGEEIWASSLTQAFAPVPFSRPKGSQANTPTSSQPSSPAAELSHTKNAWGPSRSQKLSPLEAFKVQVNPILNKLTVERFDELAAELVDVCNLSIRTEDHFTLLVNKIFDNALEQRNFIVLYARLCQALESRVGYLIRTDGKSVSEHSFKSSLIHKCQTSFDLKETPEKFKHLDMEEAIDKIKKRLINSRIFIASLFNCSILNDSVILFCLEKLLDSEASEVDIEGACAILSTCGKKLDEDSPDVVTDAYSKLKNFTARATISPRVRCLILDTLELRERSWIPRIKKLQAKKIQDIHREAVQEGLVKSGIADVDEDMVAQLTKKSILASSGIKSEYMYGIGVDGTMGVSSILTFDFTSSVRNIANVPDSKLPGPSRPALERLQLPSSQLPSFAVGDMKINVSEVNGVKYEFIMPDEHEKPEVEQQEQPEQKESENKYFVYVELADYCGVPNIQDMEPGEKHELLNNALQEFKEAKGPFEKRARTLISVFHAMISIYQEFQFDIALFAFTAIFDACPPKLEEGDLNAWDLCWDLSRVSGLCLEHGLWDSEFLFEVIDECIYQDKYFKADYPLLEQYMGVSFALIEKTGQLADLNKFVDGIKKAAHLKEDLYQKAYSFATKRKFK